MKKLENPKYEIWNKTSFSYLSLSYLGFDGKTCQKLSEVIFNDYISWRKEEERKANLRFPQGEKYIAKGNYKSSEIYSIFIKLGKAKKELEEMNLTLEQLKDKIHKSHKLKILINSFK